MINFSHPAVTASLIFHKLLVYSIFTVVIPVYAADSSLHPDVSKNSSVTDTGGTGKEIQHTPPEHRPDYAQLRKSIQLYESQIAKIEEKDGPLSDRIAEESMGLGRAYLELGEYNNALEAFDRSLHISRVNQGPDNPTQIPILDHIIETNTALSDWEALDKNYELLYWIGRSSFKNSDTRLLGIVYRVAGWHLNAYLKKYDPIPYKHLLE